MPMILVVAGFELVDAELFLACLPRLPRLTPLVSGKLPDELIRSYGTELLPNSVGADSTDWRLLEDDLDERNRLFIVDRLCDVRESIVYDRGAGI